MAFKLGTAWDDLLGGPSTTTTTETIKPAKGSNTGLIVAGVIFGVVVLVGIILIVRSTRKNKKDS